MAAPASTPLLHPARASRAGTGKVAQTISIGRHAFLADAHPAAGGEDLGPDPHELLDAALAACTALTLTLYAQRKSWPIDDLHVEVSHDEADGVYRMRRSITIGGAVSDEQRARLLEIANKCPVHRTLSGRFEISSEIR